MAKQFIIAAIEEVFGEYILNMSKENLKIAALRGKIKLENVQLDGDLIGNHVMGAVGLSGGSFGILSCSAKSIHVSVPWKNLEKEATKFEVRGVHLICVPLIPSTAAKMYGAGTRVDPRCSLRTRAKRLVLARLERNYWNGQIPGEGPPMKRIRRAVREVERDLRKSGSSSRKKRGASSASVGSSQRSAEEAEFDETFENIVFDLNDSSHGGGVTGSSCEGGEEKSAKDSSYASTAHDRDIPELPRDWKVKLREKVLRNMEASIHDIHIRCEVSEGGLDLNAFKTNVMNDMPPGANVEWKELVDACYNQHEGGQERAADDRAFALGFTLESFVVRTANERWEVGSHDKRNPVDGTAMSSAKGHLGPNGYVVKNNKIGYFNNFSIYWDDEPPVLLAETDVLQGNYRKLSPDKIQSRVASAMDAMFHNQEPGKAVRQSLSQPIPSNMDDYKSHDYVCESLEAEIRARQSDRTRPGPISCSADVLPFDFTFNVRPHQYVQYQRLKDAIKSQQRFDTMLRQRPNVSPKTDARAWWKYAIACVTSRPNSRPWDDVLIIVRKRKRYVELVAKKNLKPSDGTGYHAGLSDKESAELMALEDLLPMEALEAFHVIALRLAYETKRTSDSSLDGNNTSGNEDSSSSHQNRQKSRGNPFRLLTGGGSGSRKRRSSPAYNQLGREEASSQRRTLLNNDSFGIADDQSASICNATPISLLDAMTLRLGKKAWYIFWKLHDANINLVFLRSRGNRPIAHAVLRSSGRARSFGRGKRDFFFDVTRCHVFHREERVLYIKSPEDGANFDEDVDDWEEGRSIGSSDGTVASSISGEPCIEGPDLTTPSRFLALPPHGTVCRIAAGKNLGSFKLSISAHPATLVWTTALYDSLSEFFNVQSSEAREDLANIIRNAATPLARKAQLALLSPASMSLHVNISAPKIWVPLSSKNPEGSLFLDAGHLKVASVKDEGETDMNWDIRAGDIRMNFIQGRSASLSGQLLSQLIDNNSRAETSIVRPFHVSVQACNRILYESDDAVVNDREPPMAGLVRCVDVEVSPVCLNLVDAEPLARTFGKWYSRGIHKVRRRVSSSTGKPDDKDNTHEAFVTEPTEQLSMLESSMPRLVSVRVDKIEIALEGHSKTLSAILDDRSLASQESFHEVAPPTRTYLVEVCDVAGRHSRRNELSVTRFSVMDASISRLRDGSLYAPLKGNREVIESQYCILVRASEGQDQSPRQSKSTKDRYEPQTSTEILRASLFHDRIAHLDEVEVDIDSVILRVTPTTLKDCAKAFRRVAELAQLMTKEMERKVHEEGRKARRRDRRVLESEINSESPNGSGERPASPTASAVTDFTGVNKPSTKPASDSSILFKVTLNESTLLAGRPTTAIERSPFQRDRGVSFAVVQVLSNALIMFQSIENPDATGMKTLHISVDNVSSLVNTEFERVSPDQAPPMIGPTGAEVRIVYATENFGCVVSQDLSLDCEALKSCLTPNDLSIFLNICKKMFERLRAFGGQSSESNEGEQSFRTSRVRPLASIIRYQKKGTGIATRVRAEIQAFSFVLLRAYKSFVGAPEFLDFNIKGLKGKLEGCMSALSGEFSAALSVNFYNEVVADWEYVVEPFPFTLTIDQMPNELVLNLLSDSSINLNLTGILLRDFAEMKFDILRDRRSRKHTDGSKEGALLSPTALSTVGLRRATETRSIKVYNRTGFDVHVVPDLSSFDPDSGMISNGSVASLDAIDGIAAVSLSLRLAQTAVDQVGDREPVYDLSISCTSDEKRLHLLRPVATYDSINPGRASLLRLIEGRASPETILTEATNAELAYHNSEPVVEWCMQNQRLKSTTVDVFSLQKGRDLLSSIVWSPEDEVNKDFVYETRDKSFQHSRDDGPEAGAGTLHRKSLSPHRQSKLVPGQHLQESNWLKPYLNKDSPEWTDMTCTLRMARERVMLPSDDWIWVNDWSVDLGGNLGDDTDADGWEYEQDFETFTRTRRYYQRGDSCRRRRWTRMRVVKPPRLDDPFRQLKFVWETSKDENGNYNVIVRSHVRVKNATATPISFFAYSPSWDEDVYIGTANSGEDLCVPVNLSSAVYLRLAKRVGSNEPVSIRDCISSERFVILPTSHTSTNYIRTTMRLEDVSGTTLHYLVEIKSSHGIEDITIFPVLRVINLLPCQLDCHFGEVLSSHDSRAADGRTILGKEGQKRIAQCESTSIASGKDGACTATSPWRKPHISLRVPGYQWSPWQRIVNRRANSETWRPSEREEDWHFNSKGDADFAEEQKTIVRFRRAGLSGDPLSVILSVECGHCPTLRVYSQYWIIDKTGFGCRFSEGFTDLIGSIPDGDTSRRSHLPSLEAKEPAIKRDLSLPGHQWSIGMSGMTMYFSPREKLTLAIETGVRNREAPKSSQKVKSNWVSPLDISNVVPKTVFSVDELNGPRRFELAVSVTLCQGIFSRTKLITLLPRYQIVNLLHRELVIAQDGCLEAETLIPSQAAVPFHWEKGSLAPKVRLGAPSTEEKASGVYDNCWTNGRFRVDRVGITSMRLPTNNKLTKIPLVVQAEVRLASKEQSSAVVIVLWAANQDSNPLYILRNLTPYTILCHQPLRETEHQTLAESSEDAGIFSFPDCSTQPENDSFECHTSDIGPMITSFLGLDSVEEFVWVLKSNDVTCFGFDDPEKPHVIEWTCVTRGSPRFDETRNKAYLEVDAMGSTSVLLLPGRRPVRCQIGAEHSTKVIEFVEFGPLDLPTVYDSPGKSPLEPLQKRGKAFQRKFKQDGITLAESLEVVDEDEDPAFSLRIDVPGLFLSVVDNVNPANFGREILLFHLEKIFFSFSQTREGYHEFEMRIVSLQVDNHVLKSIHPVLIFCPRLEEREPLLHMSAVRRLQQHSNTYVFRYAAIRLLEVDIFLDRRTAECIARFIEPLLIANEDDDNEDHPNWVSKLTASMGRKFATPDRNAPREIEKLIHTANSGRIYFEQLHLHPVRLGLTFTQEWMEWNPGAENMMLFQFIRGMASIANAPLVFTSFVVSHVFEAPQALVRVVATHYSSQLTKQVFGILGSLAILGAPADFISNVGTGVRDFFYEPIQGAVHGPRQFIEGLEAGTQSLARGVFVGVVRGAANLTDVLNSNLAGLTADDDFIDERKAHQRMLTDAMSRGVTDRCFVDSLSLAGSSIVRGLKSGALGVVEQPSIYASKHGPVGFVKGCGKAIVGAVVKPLVGVGDAAVLVMNHMSDATSKTQMRLPRIPKRLRRALPCRSTEKPNCVRLQPYDERAAKAQKIVTGGESIEDVYLGHINIPSHLLIASEQCLWAIDKRSRDPWCVSWEEISHFGLLEGGVPVVVFSQTGLRTYVFDVDSPQEAKKLHGLLSMQKRKMGNSSELNSAILNTEPESLSRHQIPGIKAPQVNHVFGSCNQTRKRLSSVIKDEVDLVEQCFGRVFTMGSDTSTFFKTLDHEAWSLVCSWGQVFSGLSSRRCIVASVINGTGSAIQIKSTKLMEGGSPCYSIPTREFDQEQGILYPGGVIIFFGWGVVPNLLQPGRVFMHIETSGFIADLAHHKSRETYAEAMPGYQIGFLEKSYDESGWWAKYWLLLRAKT